MRRAFVTGSPPSLVLEPNVLQHLGGLAVQPRSGAVVAAPGLEIAARHPGGCAVTRRAELLERGLGSPEGAVGVVETILLEQGAAERELGHPAHVEIAVAALEQPDRLRRLLLGEIGTTGAEMHLRERADGLRRVAVVADVERDPEGLLQL